MEPKRLAQKPWILSIAVEVHRGSVDDSSWIRGATSWSRGGFILEPWSLILELRKIHPRLLSHIMELWRVHPGAVEASSWSRGASSWN
jgi:hypothetical protein